MARVKRSEHALRTHCGQITCQVLLQARAQFEEAYTYIINGKPALEWVMERQSVTTDKDSGITKDANLWATETMNNAKYPLELLLRVITGSLETTKVVNALTKLELFN